MLYIIYYILYTLYNTYGIEGDGCKELFVFIQS